MTLVRMRRLFLILFALCLVLPILMSVLDVWGPGSVLLGACAAIAIGRGFGILSRDLAGQANDALFRPGSNTAGRTIYVTLINERGMLLPRHERERRLEEAYRSAGPRDTVVEITKKA